MEGLIKLTTLMVTFVGFVGSCYGYTFYAGGQDGWVINPRESYDHWAGRNRFQVNDTLVFKYKQGEDSVLVVTWDEYYKCNKSNPIQILHSDKNNSTFKFDRSGPFFFISGYGNNCENGQKLIIVVLAVRHNTHPPLAPPPAPYWQPMTPPSLAPSHSPSSDNQPNVPALSPVYSTATNIIVGGWVCFLFAWSIWFLE